MNWKLPNQLTIARIALAGAFFVLLGLYRPGAGGAILLNVAFGLYIVAGITDVLDGYFARKWNIVSAFGRIMRETEAARPSSIVYDDTPIHVFMSRIHGRLLEAGRLRFRELFQPMMHKSTLIGIFLAILELVRHHQVRVDQNSLFGEIWIVPILDGAAPLDLSDVDEYEHISG